MKKLLTRKEHLIVSLLEVLVGIVLLCKPVGFTSTIIILAGILLCLSAIRNLVRYFRLEPVLFGEGLLAKGLIELLAGLFCIFRSEWFIAKFPVITVLYGIGLFVLGIGKLQWMTDLIRLGVGKWHWAAIAAALTLIPAVLIILNPFTSTAFLWSFVAVSLIVDAVMDMVSLFIIP